MAVTPLDVLWNPESISLPRGGAVYFGVTELADPCPRRRSCTEALCSLPVTPRYKAKLCRVVTRSCSSQRSRCRFWWEARCVLDPVSWLLWQLAAVPPRLAVLLKSSSTSCCSSPQGLFTVADAIIQSASCASWAACEEKHLGFL